MSENFLSRWSKRKLEVRAQEKLAEEAPAIQGKASVSAVNVESENRAHELVKADSQVQPVPDPELPLPTEADLLAVKQGGDIKAFMVDKVSTELKNKAFKALFSRPEFNVMDGLDIYIDDYNKFTPLSKEDIGKMTLSKQLLSRPDLEIPKKGDIQAGLEKLESTLSSPDDSVSTVLDKTEGTEELELGEFDTPNDARVIPDNSQDADFIEETEKRSFETPEKK
ncbi:MAG: DUF3306 domain-containing protein [Gammaproteobacteria bacterium]|nr:DUF3306 domain-containing protein [Gammaproteobacteria bacterium]